MFCIYTYNFEFLIYVNLGHYNLRQSSRKRDVGYAYALLCEKVLLALQRIFLSTNEERTDGLQCAVNSYVHQRIMGQCANSFIIWLAPQAGKMSQILCYSSVQDEAIKKNFSKSHIMNPLLIKLVGQDGLILTSSMDSVLVHEHAN